MAKDRTEKNVSNTWIHRDTLEQAEKPYKEVLPQFPIMVLHSAY